MSSANRPARRRRGQPRQRGLARAQVPILVVRNRAGQTSDSVLEVADKASVSRVLRIAVAPDAVLCTDGSNFPAAMAKALDRNTRSGTKPASLLMLALGS